MSPMGMTPQHLVPIASDPMSPPVPMIVTPKGSISMPQPSPMLSPTFDPTAYGVYPYPASTVQPLSDVRVNNSVPTMLRSNYCHQHYNYAAHRHNSAVDAAADPNSSSPTKQLASSPTKSILIQNLSSDATVQTLKDHLRTAGSVEQCEIPEDRKPGRRKGYATASFRTAEEAKRAVALFDNTVFMGVRIRVRFDTDGSGDSGEVNGGSDTRRRRSEVERRTSATTSSTATSADNSGSGGKKDDKGKGDGDSASKKNLDKREPLVVNGSSVGKKATKVTMKKTGAVDYDGEYLIASIRPSIYATCTVIGFTALLDHLAWYLLMSDLLTDLASLSMTTSNLRIT